MVVSTGSGDSTSGSTYCGTTPATNGSANNCAGRGAAPRLCNSLGRKQVCRKAKQEQ
jgi:hypothetical protein